MSDDDNPIPENPPAVFIETVEQPDGTQRGVVHTSECARTREVHQALREGREPPPPERGTRCGPAKVTSEAYRRGWDGINWGSGSKKTVGQA